MLKKIFTLFLASFGLLHAKSQIVINEYSCSNINTVADAYGGFEDWVELYNAGATNVNLTGYYLSDDPTDLMKWQIPAIATNINSNGFQMVYCSDRGTVNGAQIHPSFRLTQTKNEWFLISDPSGVLVDSVHLNLTQRGHSRGRTTNGGGTWAVFTTPSANGSNNVATAFTKYSEKPTFSLAPGFYSSAQTVSLSVTDPNVTIRYTIDGSLPTAGSPVYASPINVTVGAGPVATVIRAIGYSSNAQEIPSFTETNTYITNEVTTMNIISICGPMNTLFASSAQPYVSYEYFDKNHNFIEEFEGVARRHGHDSWAYAQKGFKIYPKDETGTQGSYEHKYFRTSTRNEFDMLIFKAGASDNYPFNGNFNSGAHMRDAFAHTLAEKYELDMDFRRYEPTIIYINGQYWGVYEIRERVDKDHKEYYYGKKEKWLDQLQNWGGLTVTAGTSTGWTNLFNFITTNNMAIPANYQIAKDSLNMKSFCQYLIFNQYIVNSDWLNWNTMWWRARGNNPVKWRYALWDCDNIFDLGQNYTGLGSTTFNNDPCDVMSLFQGSSGANNGHAKMLTSLLDNPEFKILYDEQWLELLNGPFECTNILNHYDSIRAIVSPEMPRQIARWGGTVAGWTANADYLKSQIVGRCAVIAGALSDTGCISLNPQPLKLNVSPAGSGVIAMDNVVKSPYVWSKTIRADTTYELKATPTAGAYWTFDHWEKQDPANTFNPNATTDLITYGFKNKDSVIAFFKYFNYDSVDVTFDVNPPGTGSISLNGNTIPTYPTTIKLDRRFEYEVTGIPTVNHSFLDWQKNNANTVFTPNQTSKTTKFKYVDAENIVANFKFIPPPPPLPELTKVDKRVFVPNGFSPNEDGKNDVFNIRVGKDATGMDMVIVDRWGNEVFHGNVLGDGWDGKIKGRNAEVGTYQYLIKVRFRDQQVETLKGDLSLIR